MVRREQELQCRQSLLLSAEIIYLSEQLEMTRLPVMFCFSMICWRLCNFLLDNVTPGLHIKYSAPVYVENLQDDTYLHETEDIYQCSLCLDRKRIWLLNCNRRSISDLIMTGRGIRL